ncbi:hypothetical protein TRICI_003894 [Trichomonascus ciferrii]|uniref:DNA ligase n=1 Tax=Trichomonascus ciferrii TaxID=44093 RepID=A0A642V2F2_9ASCO|nr:hypothetical protein TRICI_003894 [Trichomonascus ciferrii]
MGMTQEALNNFFKPKKKAAEGQQRAASTSNDASKRTMEAPEKEENAKRPKIETKDVKEEAETDVPSMTSGNPIPYKALTDTFEKVEATTKRLEINSILTDFFLQVLKTNPRDLSKVTYLFINKLGPDYEGVELGLGESIIMKALGEGTGRTLAQVKNSYHKLGDLGLVALESRRLQATMFSPKPLTVNSVFEGLSEIAQASGQASQTKKVNAIKRMLTACKGVEAKFLVRSLEGKLRIGVAEKSVLTSLAQAFVAWEKEVDGRKPMDVSKAEELIRDVHCQLPNYEIIINTVIDKGLENLADACKITPGVPLKPMLAKPTKSITEILDRFSGESFTCEYKYDGERAQVHKTEDGKYHVYSRNLEDMSQRYPDIVSIAPKFANETTTSFILDCEAVAWDREQNKILPFQVLSTRKRKDVEEGSITVRICLFVFDILYLNGESVLQKPLSERRQHVIDNFQLVEGEFAHAKSMNTNNIDEIQTFLDQSLKDGCEGLMIKMLEGKESGYEPSKRSRNWLKLKKDYLSGVGDSLDLVVLGAYYGRGKRTNVYGGFLLGCYNTDTEEYETVCKIGTGFSEANLEEFHKQLSDTVVGHRKSYVSHDSAANQQPDVWFEPKYVWEVLTADLSLSPVYRAGAHEMGKGISLRFPRFIRVRDDKGPEDATSTEQVVDFYRKQANNSSTNNNADEEY